MPRSRLTGGVTIAALSRLAILFIGFFFQIMVAKALPAGEYASYAVALAVSVVVVTLLSLGITRSLPRFLPVAIAYGTVRDLRRTTAGYLAFRLASLMIISVPLWIMHEHYASFFWQEHAPSRLILLSWIIVG